MKTALILHGWDGDSQNNWFPWLKNELKARGYECIIPDLPSSANPTLEEHLSVIDRYASEFKKWDIIIWHSLGCKLAINYIEKHNITGVIALLVAPVYPWLTDELGKEVFWEAYNNLQEYFDSENTFEDLWNKHVVFLSEDDPYINLESAEDYYSQFENVEFIEFEDKWHFNTIAGVLQLDEILEYTQ